MPISPRPGDGLDDDEKGICPTYTLGGPQEMLTVNEPGLYHLMMRSDEPGTTVTTGIIV